MAITRTEVVAGDTFLTWRTRYNTIATDALDKTADIDDTPVNGVLDHAISSNWAFDHVANANPHTLYLLISNIDDTPVNGVINAPISSNWAFDHDVADDHISHSSIDIIAGNGLTGGGTIAADRTLTVVGGEGITANANDISATWGGTGSATTISRSDHTHHTYDYSTTISGATVFDEIDVTNGIVTNISTRALTLANLGYTGATDANKYVHPTETARTESGDTGALTGATVISDLDFNMASDTLGHVTAFDITTLATRELTPANIGALAVADIDDTPVNGVINAPISSNWAFDLDTRTRFINNSIGTNNYINAAGSGTSITTGYDNVLIGFNAGYKITEGRNNTCVGDNAGNQITTGHYNLALGTGCLSGGSVPEEVVGNWNVAVGLSAANYLVSGDYNTCVGNGAGGIVYGGDYNVYLGANSGWGSSSGNTSAYNIGIGTYALANVDGNHNIGIGYRAGREAFNTALYNIILGYEACSANNTASDGLKGSDNIIMGRNAATFLKASYQNVIMGKEAGVGSDTWENTSHDNIYMGYKSGYVDYEGIHNVAIGTESMSESTGADYNVAIGYRALYGGSPASTNCNYNVAIGYLAGFSHQVGTDNVFIGRQAGYFSTLFGEYNVFIGMQAGYNLADADHNIALGEASLRAATGSTANYNIGMGYRTGYLLTTGYENILIGKYAGDSLTTGYDNIIIGNDTAGDVAAVHNSIVLGATASNQGNDTIMLGNSAMGGGLYCYETTITSPSDIRDKTDINPLEIGLEFISKIEPIIYRLDPREQYEDGDNSSHEKAHKQINSGVKAQQVQEVCDELGVEFTGLRTMNNGDTLTMGYTQFIPVLINAVRELKAEIELLKAA